ncbi:hypothetical protein J6590_082740 [Homalodisca vitripennis]|nr:hypothetical protein J6590_082740 [Homalodisca vitripennis]
MYITAALTIRDPHPCLALLRVYPRLTLTVVEHVNLSLDITTTRHRALPKLLGVYPRLTLTVVEHVNLSLDITTTRHRVLPSFTWMMYITAALTIRDPHVSVNLSLDITTTRHRALPKLLGVYPRLTLTHLPCGTLMSVLTCGQIPLADKREILSAYFVTVFNDTQPKSWVRMVGRTPSYNSFLPIESRPCAPCGQGSEGARSTREISHRVVEEAPGVFNRFSSVLSINMLILLEPNIVVDVTSKEPI